MKVYRSMMQVVEVSGKDAPGFLHGMLTQDVRNMAEFSCLPFCSITRIGRMVALGFIARLPDKFLLIVEGECAERLVRHLTSFIISEKVSVTLSEEFTTVCEHAAESPGSVPCLRISRPIYEQTGEVAAGISRLGPHGQVVLTRDDSDTIPIDDSFEAMRISFGFPRLHSEITEDTIPPELALENVAVSYSKGCYLGQEIIQRIRTYGNPAERLFQLSESGDARKNFGEPIFHDGKRIGRFTSSVFLPAEKRTVSLCFISREFFRLVDEMKLSVPPFAKFYSALTVPVREHPGCGGRVLRIAYGKFEQSKKNPARFACCDTDPVNHIHGGCTVNLHATHMCEKCFSEFEIPFQK